MSYLVLLLLLGWQTNTAQKTLVRSQPGELTQVIEITATVKWYDCSCVGVTARALYTKPLPFCPVRLATICRARSERGRYIDTWDGFILNKVHKGIRVYLDKSMPLATDYVNGQMYVVDGICPQAGRLLATKISPVN